MTDIAESRLAALLVEHRPSLEQPRNILRTLLSVQQVFGHVPPESVLPIAAALGVTEADVAGVLTYYPDLHTKRRGRHVIRLCMGEACVANRSPRLLTDLRQELGIDLGETTTDGRFTLERVYCLGNCAVGPTVMVDDVIHGRTTASALCDRLKDYT